MDVHSETTDSRFVVGIDPSIAGTAVAVYRADGSHSVKRFASKSQGDKVRNRVDRYLATISHAIDFIGENPPEVIAIEGYSFGSNRQNFIAEFGGLLRADLCVYAESKIFEVAPSTLKKFVTGKGHADKIAVVSAILKRWDAGFSTDDEFDAYGLARIAACIAEIEEPENQKQAECLKTVTGKEFEVSEPKTRFRPTQQPTLPF